MSTPSLVDSQHLTRITLIVKSARSCATSYPLSSNRNMSPIAQLPHPGSRPSLPSYRRSILSRLDSVRPFYLPLEHLPPSLSLPGATPSYFVSIDKLEASLPPLFSQQAPRPHTPPDHDQLCRSVAPSIALSPLPLCCAGDPTYVQLPHLCDPAISNDIGSCCCCSSPYAVWLLSSV